MHLKGMRQDILNYPVKNSNKTFRDIWIGKKKNPKNNGLLDTPFPFLYLSLIKVSQIIDFKTKLL